jgi:hypothetical protein
MSLKSEEYEQKSHYLHIVYIVFTTQLSITTVPFSYTYGNILRPSGQWSFSLYVHLLTEWTRMDGELW